MTGLWMTTVLLVACFFGITLLLEAVLYADEQSS